MYIESFISGIENFQKSICKEMQSQEAKYLVKHYGPELIDFLDRFTEDPEITLQFLAKKFGLTHSAVEHCKEYLSVRHNKKYMDLKQEKTIRFANYTLLKSYKKRYGQKIINDIARLLEDPSYSLKKFGNEYNVCRERARQIFTGITGLKFAGENGILSEKRSQSLIENPKEITLNEITEKFYTKCLERELETERISKNKLIVNGYKVSCYKLNCYNNYMRTGNISKTAARLFDFVVGEHTFSENDFFIIPTQILKMNKNGSSTVYIRAKQNTFKRQMEAKYYEYLNAYQQLLDPKK
jgi:hypothetical protein